MSERALSFGAVAEDYDRWRPGYPDTAVDWLAPDAPATVVEIGAGTGRLTRSLLARGLAVDVVEPDDRMRAVLARNLPAARCHAGDSLHLPVPDGSADAVVVADAWHWFDAPATMKQVRRVLRPGGWLGLVWNVVAEPEASWEHTIADPSDSWERERKGRPAGLRQHLPLAEEDELDYFAANWVWDLDPVHYAALRATTSMAIAQAPDDRAAWLDEARARWQRGCDEAGVATLPVRHRASCVRWTPRPGKSLDA